MNRLDIRDKSKCTGCGACQNACPRDAISMAWDEEGFPYPSITDQCIDCGKCVDVCPLIKPLPNYGLSLNAATVYAAWSNDDERRIQSTSGGVFSELAISVYEQGGVVVGAVYDEAFMIHHECSESAKDLVRLRQSKYAQSDIRLIFREIKIVLAECRLVLFCGTPCQAAGLRAYLGGVPDNLLLCDFICRGINSPKAYQSYLKMLEQLHDAKVTYIQFKNKDMGWHRFHTKVGFDDGSIHHQDRNTDPFMQAYLKHNLIMRPCCHVCCFKGNYRNGDLTLGDFWGIEKCSPELDVNKGTSVVIASSNKGISAINALGSRISAHVMSINQVHCGNPCLTQSSVAGAARYSFLTQMDELGFNKALKRHTRNNIIMKIRNLLGGIKCR